MGWLLSAQVLLALQYVHSKVQAPNPQTFRKPFVLVLERLVTQQLPCDQNASSLCTMAWCHDGLVS